MGLLALVGMVALCWLAWHYGEKWVRRLADDWRNTRRVACEYTALLPEWREEIERLERGMHG